jgi:molecular chaperone HscB
MRSLLRRLGPEKVCETCKVRPGCTTETGKDFFSLLGIPIGYKIDIKSMESKYKRLQAKSHPDVNPGNEDFCALLNKAVSVLKSPIDRAAYLIELHKNKKESEDFQLMKDQGFLMEIMEINEAIDDLIDSHRKNPTAALESALVDINHKLSICDERVAEFYEKHDFIAVEKELEKMRFYKRISDRINDALML